MKVTVVGCSGSFPGPQSPASCYLVEHDGCRLLLDMGNGSLGSLQRHTDMYAIDGVVISHLHVDHFIDLCSYYVARKYRPAAALPPIPVWGPTGTRERLLAAYGLDGASDMAGEFDVRPVPSRFSIGPFTITTAPVRHPLPTTAIRVDADDRSVTYSGDTGPTPALIELARGSDLALFEGSFLTGDDNPPDLHLTGREAGEHAAAAGVGQLVVTHLVPWNSTDDVIAEARTAFPGAVAASPGLTVQL